MSGESWPQLQRAVTGQHLSDLVIFITQQELDTTDLSAQWCPVPTLRTRKPSNCFPSWPLEVNPFFATWQELNLTRTGCHPSCPNKTKDFRLWWRMLEVWERAAWSQQNKDSELSTNLINWTLIYSYDKPETQEFSLVTWKIFLQEQVCFTILSLWVNKWAIWPPSPSVE